MQGKKTHEQQVRILERKPDVPDARQTKETLKRSGRDDAVHRGKLGARQSEWPVSRGGLNQESDHNKHNDPGKAVTSLSSPDRPNRSNDETLLSLLEFNEGEAHVKGREEANRGGRSRQGCRQWREH
jgi:hypothetical protein